MVKTNLDIICEWCSRSNDGVQAVSDEDKIAWKSYHEKLFNTEFSWDRNSLCQVVTVSSLPFLIDKVMIRGTTSKMKNGKSAGLSGVVSEMVKSAGETGVDILTDLINQTILEGVIPAEGDIALL